MKLVLYTAPTLEPIGVDELAAHLRIEQATMSSEEAWITAAIVAARQEAETKLNRVLVQQTWDWSLDAFPASGDALMLPKSPVSSVTSISYKDTAGATQTWSTAEWQLALGDVARIAPKEGYSWPDTQCETFDTVTVRFVAGYGATAASVPQAIRHWLLAQAGAYYEHRETHAVVEIQPVRFLDGLLDPYRLVRFG